MTTKQPIVWMKQPVHCAHSPNDFHYIHLGYIDNQVVYFTCDCELDLGTEYCFVENALREETDNCFAALTHMRLLLKNSYNSADSKKSHAKVFNKIRDHLIGVKNSYSRSYNEHKCIMLLRDLSDSANDVRQKKTRPYKHYKPLSYVARKAFLLEKFVRRNMGETAPMFHVHPHENGEKLVLRLSTTKILTCGLDLESDRRKHQSWIKSNRIHHSNSESDYCLFCRKVYYNMGAHTIGQGHMKRVAESVIRARYIMSPDGLRGMKKGTDE